MAEQTMKCPLGGVGLCTPRCGWWIESGCAITVIAKALEKDTGKKKVSTSGTK
ncbi:MAG: hypothetical protein KKA41_17845 [Proteobacteria bacterium]|nr:hypothetical protein [Pseudomonadota bacterium]